MALTSLRTDLLENTTKDAYQESPYKCKACKTRWCACTCTCAQTQSSDKISITISSCIADRSPRNNISLQIGYQNSSPIVARSKSLIHFDCALHTILLLLISPTVSAMVGASIHGLAEESVTSRKQLNLPASRTHQPLLVTPDSVLGWLLVTLSSTDDVFLPPRTCAILCVIPQWFHRFFTYFRTNATFSQQSLSTSPLNMDFNLNQNGHPLNSMRARPACTRTSSNIGWSLDSPTRLSSGKAFKLASFAAHRQRRCVECPSLTSWFSWSSFPPNHAALCHSTHEIRSTKNASLISFHSNARATLGVPLPNLADLNCIK